MSERNKNLNDRYIRSMPYDSRIRQYEREKQILFSRSNCLSVLEIQKAHDDLIRKWRV